MKYNVIGVPILFAKFLRSIWCRSYEMIISASSGHASSHSGDHSLLRDKLIWWTVVYSVGQSTIYMLISVTMSRAILEKVHLFNYKLVIFFL